MKRPLYRLVAGACLLGAIAACQASGPVMPAPQGGVQVAGAAAWAEALIRPSQSPAGESPEPRGRRPIEPPGQGRGPLR